MSVAPSSMQANNAASDITSGDVWAITCAGTLDAVMCPLCCCCCGCCGNNMSMIEKTLVHRHKERPTEPGSERCMTTLLVQTCACLMGTCGACFCCWGCFGTCSCIVRLLSKPTASTTTTAPPPQSMSRF